MSPKDSVFKKSGFPVANELVVAKVKRILAHCVFLDLLEYDNKEGMLHISEIAPGWVKNIRAHLQENQQVICKVMSIDKEKGYIDLSVKRVSAGEKNAKMNDWKIEKKMNIMLNMIGERLKKKSEVEKITKKIIESYDSLSELFSEVGKQGMEALKKVKIPDKWKEEMLKSIQEHIKSHRVRVTDTIKVTSHEMDGVERIKKLISSVGKGDGFEISINYLGTPNYQITILANNYKKAEDAMDSVMDEIEKLSKEMNIEFSRGK